MSNDGAIQFLSQDRSKALRIEFKKKIEANRVKEEFNINNNKLALLKKLALN